MATILNQPAYTFDDVLIKPQFSDVESRKDVDTSVEIAPGITLSTPLIPSNMQSVISVELCVKLHELGAIGYLHQFCSIEEEVKMLHEVKSKNAKVAAAVGTTKDYLERAKALIDNGVELIIMDTPHAHNTITINAVKEFRKKFGTFPLIAGNIATRDAAIDLIIAGVNGVKVGVGPGAACLTRINAGAGYPQLSAVMEVAEVAKKYGVSVIADGGVQSPGNFAKAIGAGGTIVMCGSLFAGVDESPSELVEVNGQKYKKYWGSSSEVAKELRSNADPRYKNKPNEFVEGAAGLTRYHGSCQELVDRLVMGLRSAMSYSGAKTIKEFQKKVIFVPITSIGMRENGAHGLIG